jgi:hypothetical protein
LACESNLLRYAFDSLATIWRISEWLAASLEMMCPVRGCGFDPRVLRLGPLAVGRFRLAMCRLLTDRPDIVFLDARTQRSGTQCNGTRTRWLFKLRRCRSMIEAVRGNLRTGPDCDRISLRVREEARTEHWTERIDRAFLTCVKSPPRNQSKRVDRNSGKRFSSGLLDLFSPTNSSLEPRKKAVR